MIIAQSWQGFGNDDVSITWSIDGFSDTEDNTEKQESKTLQT